MDKIRLTLTCQPLDMTLDVRHDVDVRHEKPTALIITGDFNCKSFHWWEGDDECPQGTALDEFIETNNLCN